LELDRIFDGLDWGDKARVMADRWLVELFASTGILPNSEVHKALTLLGHSSALVYRRYDKVLVWEESGDNGKSKCGLFASLRVTEQKRKQIPFGDDKTRRANATAATTATAIATTTVTAAAAATTELRVEVSG
jgi:hypothetical protein